MNTIERLDGIGVAEVMGYDWPSIDFVGDCFGYEFCRNVRLSSGRVIGREEVRRRRECLRESLSRYFEG